MKFEKFGDDLPQKVRVSLGSSTVLGIQEGRLDAAPTTAYLMTYRQRKCAANCGFCSQASRSQGRADMLSRISWPAYPTELVLNGIEKAWTNAQIKRVCIQALRYPKAFRDLVSLVRGIHLRMTVPISVSCQPLNSGNMSSLADAGIERIGIPLDAATSEIFDKVKGSSAGGPYDWEKQLALLVEAVSIFGKGRVSTHLIVGLGETEREMVYTIQRCVDMCVLPALFAFTPIPGTALESMPQPPIEAYRRMQIARHLILHGITRYNNMFFDKEDYLADFGVQKAWLTSIIQSGEPFLTSGCPDCNRPYYNEKPSGPLYNYPRKVSEDEVSEIEKQLFVCGSRKIYVQDES